MMGFHNIDVCEKIPMDYLCLSVNCNTLNKVEIHARYPKEISEKILSLGALMKDTSKEYDPEYAIEVQHSYFITKDPSKANFSLCIDNNAKEGVQIVKEILDPNEIYNLSETRCVIEINKR